MATLGELIKLLHFTKSQCENHNDIELSKLLVKGKGTLHIHPCHFLNTVQRILAPTKPSIIGESNIVLMRLFLTQSTDVKKL